MLSLADNMNVRLTFLENMFVYPGEIIDIPYYGQVKQFYVTSVEGDHGILEILNQDSYEESLVEDFASLNMSNEIGSNVSCNVLKYNFSVEAGDLDDSNVKSEGETSINDSNVSAYYSLCNESVDHDASNNQTSSESVNSNVMYTSTPVRIDRKSTNNPYEIYCSLCSSSTVSYYIATAATKIIIKQSHDGKSKFHQEVKEKLTYDSIGGLEKQIQILKEMVELSIKLPDVLQSYGECGIISDETNSSDLVMKLLY